MKNLFDLFSEKCFNLVYNFFSASKKRMIPKSIPLYCLNLILCLDLTSCNTIDPKLEPELLLKLEDVTCTEAWLQLTTTNIQLPATINLLKNNVLSQIYVLNTQDSLLYIDSLLPNQTYKFKVVLNTTNNPLPTTNEVQLTAMDTTSHNFTWQTFEFGQHSSSILYDVAIINENNIWAVGEIYMNDSIGNPDLTRYNLAFWNGSSWEIKRIPYFYQGQPFYHPIQSVFAFSQNDIWFCGNGVIHWDGNSFIPMPIPSNVWGPYQMNKIWGSSSNDLYVVGNNGNIAHYNGINWARIMSGTTLPFQDIWGASGDDGERQILAIASNKFSTGGKYLVRLFENSAVHMNDAISTAVSLSGIWFVPNSKYYMVGDGIYNKHLLSENIWQFDQIISLIQYYPYCIRGVGINDLVVCGDAGTISHFNGANWRIFERINLYDRLLSVSTIKDIVITVGIRYNNSLHNQGIIYYGRR
jgi:hypothetical protein